MNRTEISSFIEFIKDQKTEEEKLLSKIETLKSDCEQFELSKPIIQVKTVDWSAWQVIEDFWNELTLFGQVRFVKMKT